MFHFNKQGGCNQTTLDEVKQNNAIKKMKTRLNILQKIYYELINNGNN